jgi:hypothetical protein
MNEWKDQKDRQTAKNACRKFVYSANYIHILECYQLLPTSMAWNVELTPFYKYSNKMHACQTAKCF